jgi:hypothetical protein
LAGEIAAMTKLKIDAPLIKGADLTYVDGKGHPISYVRLVRESDWRRIMAVLRAADEHNIAWANSGDAVSEAAAALRAHLEKRK